MLRAMRRLVLVLAVALVAAPAATSTATASPRLELGITDSGAAYYGDGSVYPTLRELHAAILRVHLNWGGKLGVARGKPVEPADPEDRAYDWRLYDRIVLAAAANRVQVMFTIFGTPPWANGGHSPTHAPRDVSALEDFSYAAATRYSGSYTRADGTTLPAVRRRRAWLRRVRAPAVLRLTRGDAVDGAARRARRDARQHRRPRARAAAAVPAP